MNSTQNEPHKKRNTVFFIAGESFWGMSAAFVASSTVLTVLLRDLGAGDRMIGSIGAIETACLVFPQLIGMYLFTSMKNRKRNLLIWHYVAVIPFVLIISALIFLHEKIDPGLESILILVFFAMYLAGIGLIVGIWTDWLASIFGQETRGTIMGLAMSGSALAGTAGSLIAGLVIKKIPGFDSYAILYAASGVLGAISISTFLFINDPLEKINEEKKKFHGRELLSKFKHSFKDINFKLFLAGRLIASLGFCIVPFIAVYYQSTQGGCLDTATIVTCGSAMTFGMAISNVALGKIGDKFGHRLGIILGTGMQVLTLSLILTGSGVTFCILAYFCAGTALSAAFISHCNMLIESCPHEHRIAHITAGNIAVSIPLVAAPFIAGLATEKFGLQTVFTSCLVISAVSFLWNIFLVKDPRTIDIYDFRR